MNKNVMMFQHHIEGGHVSPLVFHFPEPHPHAPVLTQQEGDHGQDWDMHIFQAKGIGRLLAFRNYDVRKKVRVISEISEPAICLSIRWKVKEDSSRAAEDADPKVTVHGALVLLEEDRKMPLQLERGELACVDLFVRPENIGELSHHPAIKSLISPFAYPDEDHQLPETEIDGQLTDLAQSIFDEIKLNCPTAERFTQLCDTLLRLFLGEEVEVEPAPPRDDCPWEQSSYEPNAAERIMLDALHGLDQKDLLVKVKTLYKENAARSRLRKTEESRNNLAKKYAEIAWAFSRENLADLYLSAAYYIAAEYEKVSSRYKAKCRKALLRACELSFELVPASPVLSAFYGRWSGQKIVAKVLAIDDITRLLSILLPAEKMNFTKDSSRRGKRLFNEQVKEVFGFRPLSQVAGQNKKYTAKEVLELYNYLMEYYVETIELNDNSIQRSNIIRELDAAYEENDFITLLQIEIDELGRVDYFNSMDLERLQWVMVALLYREQELTDFFISMETDPEYEELRLVHELDNSLSNFRREILKRKKELDGKAKIVSSDLKQLFGKGEGSHTVELADYILKLKV